MSAPAVRAFVADAVSVTAVDALYALGANGGGIEGGGGVGGGEGGGGGGSEGGGPAGGGTDGGAGGGKYDSRGPQSARDRRGMVNEGAGTVTTADVSGKVVANHLYNRSRPHRMNIQSLGHRRRIFHLLHGGMCSRRPCTLGGGG